MLQKMTLKKLMIERLEKKIQTSKYSLRKIAQDVSR